MVQSATPLIRPTREHPDEEKDALQATAPLLTQSLEDHRLAERVERALRATGYGALRTVRVSVNARVVILGGRVPSYYLKQSRRRPPWLFRERIRSATAWTSSNQTETTRRLATCDNHKASS